MANISQLENTLHSIKQNNGISDVVIVSRSGMHIAGDVPAGVHTETFVAMSAILLGAAETSTSELRDKLKLVTINLEHSTIFIKTISSRAILVLRTSTEVSKDQVVAVINEHAGKIESGL